MPPHQLPAAWTVLALMAAFALCRLPLLPTAGVAGALSSTLALAVAVTLLLALLARLCAVEARDRLLLACTASAAGLACVVRRCDVAAPVFELAFDAALITGAAALGRLFANQVQEAWWVAPLGVTGAAADLVSVFVPGAPTYEMVATGSPVLEYLLLVWPAFGPGAAQAFVGVSDFAIAAILYAHAVRFGLDAWRTFAQLGAALLLCLVLAGLAGVGLPAIPFLFAFFVAGHRRALLASYRARKRA